MGELDFYVEPSFSVYYPDMVYVNPQTIEVDLLLVLNGGYICIELKDNPAKAHEDSLKYFINALAPQPVIYMSKKPLEKGESQVQLPNPLLIPPDNELILKNQLLSELEKWRQKVGEFEEERRDFFSLDNFLCMLLLYASPMVCKEVLEKVPPFDEKKLSPLIRRRISLVMRAKGLNFSDEIKEEGEERKKKRR